MPELCELAGDCPVRRRRAEARRLIADPKRKGELAELAFALCAASHGLIVSKPYGETAPYDFLVHASRRPLRVQVKAAFTASCAGYAFNLITGLQHRRYTRDDIDFLAAYIGPLDLWYIFPIEIIESIGALTINPSARPGRRGARFEPYREAWHLLTRKPRSKKQTTQDEPV
ncbi:MAG TPA: group I intron-associated PD-(D/E)XK endonuclease [Terriglobales bacterium]|nr:group I intron-associated PD-(D/E)XK endonuclease [Terriglobales bacterium]